MDEQFFADADAEFVGGGGSPALKAKAYALSNGDLVKTRATYVRLRAEQLKAGHAESQASASQMINAICRLHARMLDAMIFLSVATLALNFFAPELPFGWWIALGIVGAIFCEAIALRLSKTGATPGKFLLGIQVQTVDGAAVDLKTALERTIGAWALGTAFQVPAISLLPMTYSYFRLRATGTTVWDSFSHTKVVHAPVTWPRVTSYLVAWLLLSFLSSPVWKHRVVQAFRDWGAGIPVDAPSNSVIPEGVPAQEPHPDFIQAGFSRSSTIDDVATWAYGKYPFLNSQDQHADARAIESVIAWRNDYMSRGLDAPQALWLTIEAVGLLIVQGEKYCFPAEVASGHQQLSCFDALENAYQCKFSSRTIYTSDRKLCSGAQSIEAISAGWATNLRASPSPTINVAQPSASKVGQGNEDEKPQCQYKPVMTDDEIALCREGR